MAKFTDITNLTDAALDVFLRVKAGEDVTVAHLTAAERASVCEALAIPPSARLAAWLGGPSGDATRGRRVARDVEGMILDRQDAFYEGE